MRREAVGPAPDHVGLHARLQPERLALLDLATDQRWSYAELHVAVRRYATVLAGHHGARPGTRIAALAKNSAELAILHLACSWCGLIFVPLNWRLAPAELKMLVEDCAPALVLYDSHHAATAQALTAASRSLADLAGQAAHQPPMVESVPVPADQPAVILYTSGTSGRPKGVIITERNIFYSACNLGVLTRLSWQSVFICEGPLFHVIGLLTSLRSPLIYGGTVLMSDGFDPGRTLARLADPGLSVTHYFCVPQMANMLRNHPDFSAEKLRGLSALVTGGAPHAPAEIQWWVERGIPLVNGFGMTETGSTMGMSLELDVIRRKLGSVGLPAPSVEMLLAGEDGLAVRAGEPGELWLRGPAVTPGYWQREEENAKAFTADGWFKTGDMARADEDGFVYIVDRKKDMFISGGENVYPGEVERVLLEHPAIAEASVVGVPDARWGEVGCAFLVARGGTNPPSDAELAEFCSARLARYKIPKLYVWVDALPRTASGKILKHQLREGHSRAGH